MLLGLGVALLVLFLYLGTLAPTVLYYDRPTMFDSAMLQAEVSVLGIAHPTGYPTYIMLTHLFTYLPVGDVAYRINLASAIYGVAAVVMIYIIGLRLSRRAVAAAVGALAFGLGETFWSQAAITEVYTLDILFMTLVIFTLLVWRDSGKDRYLLLSTFLIGLSLTHHAPSGLFIPAGLAFVFLVDRQKLLEAKLLFKGLGLFLVGLTPWLYLPIRAVMDAPMNESDPSSLGRFLLLITGGSFLAVPPQMQAQCSVSALEEFPGRLHLYWQHLLGEFPIVLVVIGALAMLYMFLTYRAAVVLLGTIFLGSVLHALLYLTYGIEDFYVFLIPAYLIFSLWIAVGVGALLRLAEGMNANSLMLKRALLLALSVLALVSPLIGVRETYAEQDRSQDYRGRQTIEAVAQNAEKYATILHHRSPLWYMTLVEQRRRDLRLLDPFCTSWVRYNDIVWPDHLNSAQSAARYKTDDPTGIGAAREAAKLGPVYILAQEFDPELVGFNPVPVDAEYFQEAGFDVVQADEEGLLYELVPQD